MEKIININCYQCPFYYRKNFELYYCSETGKKDLVYENGITKIPENCPLRKSPIIVRLKDDL